MKYKIKIGDKEYKTKKDAIQYYRNILNSYNFGQSLNDSDFNDLIDLLNYDYLNNISEIELNEINEVDEEAINENDLTLFDNCDGSDIYIVDIKVARVQFNTKCFEIVLNNNTRFVISYLMIFNRTKYTPEKLFSSACRNAIHEDITKLKKEFFNKNSNNGKVKCTETGILSNWYELVVDHRQPNTFSVIVDRFIELQKIDLNTIDFKLNYDNRIIFKDANIAENFRKYHKEKASLRIVRKECNASRTNLARIKRTSNDLTIK